MAYEVVESVIPARLTAVIAETTTWDEYPELWRPRWEIYGHWNKPGDEEVQVYYLVR